jgi:hypothetical protein
MATCEGTSLSFSRPSRCCRRIGPQERMTLAQRDDAIFDLGVDLVGTGLGPMRALAEGGQPSLLIALHPSTSYDAGSALGVGPW